MDAVASARAVGSGFHAPFPHKILAPTVKAEVGDLDQLTVARRLQLEYWTQVRNLSAWLLLGMFIFLITVMVLMAVYKVF